MAAAVTALANIAQQLQAVAKKLPAAKDVLTNTAAALSLGQQFVDTIVKAQKKAG